MRDIVKRFFSKTVPAGSAARESETAHDVRVATCALFLEMGRIDKTFTPEELKTILGILKAKYGLSPKDADDLIAEADQKLSERIDYWHFTHLINTHYSTPEKIEIVETLWKIVFVDGKMDQYENYLVHKLANLLNLSHQQLIDAKLKVRHAAK